VEKREWKLILSGMTLDAENEMKYNFRHGLVRHNYIFEGDRSVELAVDQAMCSSILNLPPLLLQLQ